MNNYERSNNNFKTTYNTNFIDYTQEKKKNLEIDNSNVKKVKDKNIYDRNYNKYKNNINNNNNYSTFNNFNLNNNSDKEYLNTFSDNKNYDFEVDTNQNLNKSYNIINSNTNNHLEINVQKNNNEIKIQKPISRQSKSILSTTNSNYSYIDNENIVVKGVCSNCINLELMKLHNLVPKEKSFEEDPFSIQQKRNIIQKQNIQLKVKRNNKLSKLASENLIKIDEKTKLINQNQKSDFYIYKSSHDPLLKRTLEKYKKNQEWLLQRKYIGYNKEIEDFYNKPNPITDYSVDAIGRKAFINKYLPSKNQYNSFLSKQIENKVIRKKKEKEKDIEGENYIYNKNKKELEREKFIKKNYLRKIQKEFLDENKRLIQQKEYKKRMNKSSDLAIEQDQIKKLKEEERKKNEEKMVRKNKMKNELLTGLNNQIKYKHQISYDFEPLGKEGKFNIYCEPIHIDKYGKCIKCHRILKQIQIHPKKEYDIIKNKEKEKMNN